ncbi:MAG: ABC transporter permease, partial [Anaerolineae bacterium]|nr:ABC transporter permease [Anaerolineae bacterium]
MMKQVKPLLGPLIGLIAINAVFFLLAPTYRQPVAIRDILEQSTVLLIMATGTTIMLIAGQLDLSVGSILALVSVVTGSLLLAGLPWWVAVLGGLGAGTLCGLINGLVIVSTGVPTLVATLGMMMAARG